MAVEEVCLMTLPDRFTTGVAKSTFIHERKLVSRLDGGTGRERPVGDRPRLGAPVAPWSGGIGMSREPED